MAMTAEDAAGLAGVGLSTWRSYVARRQAPSPTGYDPATGRRVWDEGEVRRWLAARPGPGARSDLRREQAGAGDGAPR